MTTKPRLIIDCDPGQDDAVALVVAAAHAEIVGITTVGGNAPLIDVTNNALLTCQVFGIEAPVHAGAARPLVAPPRHAPEIHGVRGFSGPTLPERTRDPASTDAVGFLIESIRSEEGLWLVPIGPLTNVALALRQAPDIANRLAGISFMGGSATVGNHSAVAEFNALVDPEACAVVFESGAPLHMAGLDLTHQFVVDDSLESDVRAVDNAGAVMLADLFANYLDAAEQRNGVRRGGLHDPCAVLAITHPELIASTPRHVAIELNGAVTRGMTVVDQRGEGIGETPNVLHGHTLEHESARHVVLESIRARGALGD